jgi:hypothetical protein
MLSPDLNEPHRPLGSRAASSPGAATTASASLAYNQEQLKQFSSTSHSPLSLSQISIMKTGRP